MSHPCEWIVGSINEVKDRRNRQSMKWASGVRPAQQPINRSTRKLPSGHQTWQESHFFSSFIFKPYVVSKTLKFLFFQVKISSRRKNENVDGALHVLWQYTSREPIISDEPTIDFKSASFSASHFQTVWHLWEISQEGHCRDSCPTSATTILTFIKARRTGVGALPARTWTCSPWAGVFGRQMSECLTPTASVAATQRDQSFSATCQPEAPQFLPTGPRRAICGRGRSDVWFFWKCANLIANTQIIVDS